MSQRWNMRFVRPTLGRWHCQRLLPRTDRFSKIWWLFKIKLHKANPSHSISRNSRNDGAGDTLISSPGIKFSPPNKVRFGPICKGRFFQTSGTLPDDGMLPHRLATGGRSTRSPNIPQLLWPTKMCMDHIHYMGHAYSLSLSLSP